MVFEVSTAKKEIIERLAEQAWTPTDLAAELGKSTNTVYNHLDDLYEQGVVTKRTVEAKTRPKTEYSIGDGFVQYLAVLPGQYTEKSLTLTADKQATIRIWSIPQDEFHPYVQDYWWTIKTHIDFDYREDVLAVAVYGSVARGQADENSDIDFLVVTEDERTEQRVSEHLGSLRIEVGTESKIGMTEVYSRREFRNSVAHGSEFLETVREELHIIYDPEAVLHHPEEVSSDER